MVGLVKLLVGARGVSPGFPNRATDHDLQLKAACIEVMMPFEIALHVSVKTLLLSMLWLAVCTPAALAISRSMSMHSAFS